MSYALNNHYQGTTGTTAPYVLEPWCVPTSNNLGLDFGTHIFLGPRELVFQTHTRLFVLSI